MSSIDRAKTRDRGIKMAMRVAALTGGAAAVGVALAATDARAEEASPSAQTTQMTEEKREDVGPVQALRVDGLGRFSCMSRGPAAPPEAPEDFAALLDRLSQISQVTS